MADQQGPPADSPDELLEIVDEQNRVIGVRRRAEVHGDPRLRHRAVHIVVRNVDDAIYLQKRSKHKLIQPGRWDTSVGGHVDPGESYATAAARELAEELGIELETLGGPSALQHLHDYVWCTDVETEHVRTYQVCCEGPFALHPDEIDEGRFFSPEQLRKAVGTGILTPNLQEELRWLGIIIVDDQVAQ